MTQKNKHAAKLIAAKANLVKTRDTLNEKIAAIPAIEVLVEEELVGSDDPCAAQRAARDAAFTVRNTANAARDAAEAVFSAADSVAMAAADAYQAAEQLLLDCESP